MKTLLSVVLVTTVVVACASSGGVQQRGAAAAPKRGSRNSATCPAQIDSMFLSRGPVYRACDVDVAARQQPSSAHPDFPTSGMDRCMSAEFEFVVGVDGIPEDDAVRLVNTNNSSFAEAVRRFIPELRYTPGTKDGRPVRQLTRFASIVNVVVSSGGAIPTPPMTPTRC